MSGYQLAQLNIATLLEPLDSPRLADFVANIGRINDVAERSPGFAWRLADEAGNATSFRPFGEDKIVNLSVWEGIEPLHAFAFRSGHADIMKRRREWFERMTEAYAVLWWIPRGHRPDLQEASERLAHLRANGPTAHAFTFKDAYPAPDAGPSSALPGVGDTCPA